jgi:hypothetical protein
MHTSNNSEIGKNKYYSYSLPMSLYKLCPKHFQYYSKVYKLPGTPDSIG